MLFLLILLISLALIVIPIFEKITKFSKTSGSPDFFKTIANNTYPMIIGGILLFTSSTLIDSSLHFAREGHLYYVLSPLGKRTMIANPGYYIALPKSYIQEWERYIDVKAIPYKDGSRTELAQSTEGLEGVIPGGILIRFSDKVSANMFIATRFEIPVVEEQFFKLVETYKHPNNLVNNILIPTISEQAENVGMMFSGEDYVNGATTELRATMEDALKNGGFIVKRVESKDTLWVDDLSQNRDVKNRRREIKEIRTINKNEKVLENGIAKRTAHEINANKIYTASVIVESIKLDPEFEKKLITQRDISIEKIIELQKVGTAWAAQQRIIAEGERDKAKERAVQEIQMVSTLTAIETRVKEEDSKRQLAVIAKQTAKEEAEALLIKERAQAEASRLKVAAGLSPQEKAEWDYKTKVGVAEQLAKLKMPTTMIMGDSKGGTPLEALIGAAMAKQLESKGSN